MDLNNLLYHHQISLIRAGSGCSTVRAGAVRLVRHYQTRIDRVRHEMGVAHYPDWCAVAQA